MPKKKTSKSAAKRFKLTAGGKVVYQHAGGRHLLACKSRKRKRRLGKPGVVDKTEQKRISLLLTS